MSVALPVLCRACAHSRGRACDAYPAGVPIAIGVHGADHREPRGDEAGGVVFALADGDAAARALRAWSTTFGGDVSAKPRSPSDRATTLADRWAPREQVPIDKGAFARAFADAVLQRADAPADPA